MQVFTIDPGLPFGDAFAAGLHAQLGDAPEALADVRILLPTRRACRALALAFVRQAGGRPLLLPRMTPLGDIDEDELAFADADALGLDAGLDIPPAIPALRRQLLLAQRIAGLPGMGAGPGQAARLAAELARLFDQVHTERLDLAGLDRLAPDAFAEHWQVTLDFLRPLALWWQEMLAAEGCIDPADRRNRLLAAQARAWRATPPNAPVIAAGSTGSIPATAELLAVIARLPRGAVVLPGLDTPADDETWRALLVETDDPDFPLAQAHPQHGLARLLRRLGIGRADVRPWPALGVASTAPGRAALLSRALAPAHAARPLHADGIDGAALDGVTLIEAATPEEEARTIALILRQTLERPEATAALVTPDRSLARRVAAELQRWSIAVDDSGGEPLSETAPAAFFRLVAQMVVERLAPVALLAVLKHPLAGARMAPARLRRQVRRLERAALRGPRPAPDAAGLQQALEAAGGSHARAAAPLLDALERAVAPFARLLDAGAVALGVLVEAHVAATQALAATDEEPGAARLWAGDAGEALATFVADLGGAAATDLLVEAADYPELLDVLLEGQVVRPAWGRHPRLAVWGPLEARLQRADVLVLAGLNEESWPPAARASPWMSRPMMQAFGLPLPERRIGLSAHDFAQAFCAREVWLTRACRKDGAPTVPSRWVQRLKTLLHGSAWAAENARRAHRLAHWQRLLDAPAGPVVPVLAPAPCPPVEARPRRLSVTRVETWIRDPYALYAREILRLKALPALDEEPEAADFGTAVHAALRGFVAETGGRLPEDALDRLLAHGRAALGELLQRPGVRSFWWPRFERIARWVIVTERARACTLASSAAEVSGTLELDAPAGLFTLDARADRLDRLADGTLAIIDYKTGAPPSAADVASGAAPQLPLEAAIAAGRGFTGFEDAPPVSALEYWQLKGDEEGGSCRPLKSPDSLAENALEGLRALVGAFDDPRKRYPAQPRANLIPRFGDYDHLARVAEWAAGEERED